MSVVSKNLWAELRGMLKVRFGRLKPTYDTRVIHFDYMLELLKHGQKRNVHLEMGNLKQTETEEQRKERLRIGREKIKQEG